MKKKIKMKKLSTFVPQANPFKPFLAFLAFLMVFLFLGVPGQIRAEINFEEALGKEYLSYENEVKSIKEKISSGELTLEESLKSWKSLKKKVLQFQEKLEEYLEVIPSSYQEEIKQIEAIKKKSVFLIHEIDGEIKKLMLKGKAGKEEKKEINLTEKKEELEEKYHLFLLESLFKESENFLLDLSEKEVDLLIEEIIVKENYLEELIALSKSYQYSAGSQGDLDLEREFERLAKHFQELKEKLDSLLKKAKELKEKKEEKKEKEEEEENKEENEEGESFLVLIKNLEDKYEKYEEEYYQLKEDYQEAQEEKDEEELEDLIDDLEDLKDDLDDLDDKIDELQKEIEEKELLNKLDDLEKDVKKLKKKIKKLLKEKTVFSSEGESLMGLTFFDQSFNQNSQKKKEEEKEEPKVIFKSFGDELGEKTPFLIQQKQSSLDSKTDSREQVFVAWMIGGIIILLALIIFFLKLLFS